MRKCFVMQPFDGGAFDKRYESVFAPAIREGGLEPYRVDLDPSVAIPIQEIENGIRDSEICLADITTDNPNVWFELGFSLAIPKDVVLVCSNERNKKYPFDVQHRNIIKYETGAPQYFDDLKWKITERIKGILIKKNELDRVISRPVVKDTEGLNQHEIVALVTVMQNSFLTNGYVRGYQVKNDMNSAGFTDIAVGIALKTLAAKGLIETDQWEEDRFEGESYFVYKTSEAGEHWLIDNQEKLTLTMEPEKPDPNEDIPF